MLITVNPFFHAQHKVYWARRVLCARKSTMEGDKSTKPYVERVTQKWFLMEKKKRPKGKGKKKGRGKEKKIYLVWNEKKNIYYFILYIYFNKSKIEDVR